MRIILGSTYDHYVLFCVFLMCLRCLHGPFVIVPLDLTVSVSSLNIFTLFFLPRFFFTVLNLKRSSKPFNFLSITFSRQNSFL